MAGDAYTGLRRRKQTPWSVKFGDALVSRVIAVGGIGTIAAILLVVLVLLGTALPLFKRPQIKAWVPIDLASPSQASSPSGYKHFGIDDNGLMLWGMLETGAIEVRSIQDGQVLVVFPFEGAEENVVITSSMLSIDRTQLSLGFSDGTFRVASIQFETALLSPRSLPEGLDLSEQDSVVSSGRTVYQWFDAAGVQKTDIRDVVWSEPKRLGTGPVLALDYLPDDSANLLSTKATSSVLAIVDQELVFARMEAKSNRLTRKVTETIETTTCELQSRSTDARPLQVMLMNNSDHAIVVWSNGTLDRYSLRDGEPKLAESRSAAVNQMITSAAPLLARQTLMCGLEDGRLQGWMITRPTAAMEVQDRENSVADADDYRLSLAHEIQVGEQPLVSLASSSQSHVAATCDDRGQLGLVYVTTDALLTTETYPFAGRVHSIGFGPSGATLLAVADQSLAIADLDIGYPEASWRGYFGKVWYEGHDVPKYIWQSSAATEKSEIKLSLMPLVFGTMKATVYAMLISVPLAILAAIYTSEFLPPATRGRIKPVIEMMASLPSIVLGYIAALVIAPQLQSHLMSVLLGLVLFPLTFVVAGNLWNLLPVDKLVRWQSYRLIAIALCLPIGLMLSITLAPGVEELLFRGNLIDWLSGKEGSAVGGWMLLLIPTLVPLVCLLMFGPFAEWNRNIANRRTPRAYACLALVRLVVLAIAVVGLGWGLGAAFSGLGLDLRGNLFDSYQDRNALLVGFALGFCVIPIIYTISDDALQSVPQHLRSASLACGATPWQTTIRVVVPSAMSGIFSAIMIGLGRAVGETMVVLCAAGNTPLMELNIFNGFKTLSAALATELPEAAKGSTHFRTLFLAAVLLFLMTLVANTLAEFVRIRFRKRASQL